jgi:hypothetical protein
VDPLTGKTVPPPSDRGIDENDGWFLDNFSPRELRRVLSSGPAALLRSTTFAALGSLCLSVLGFSVVAANLGDLHHRPALITTGAVVLGGFAFTAFVFHAIRIRAAYRLREQPLPRTTVETHLRVTLAFAGRAES